MLDSSDQASLEKICTGFDICIVRLVTGAVAVCERHCGRGVLMCDTDERARSDRRCLQHIRIGGSETPAFGYGGWGEPQPVFARFPALAGTDARRGLAVALEETRTAAADSEAVPIVRKAQRRGYARTGMAHATHRITANTSGRAVRQPRQGFLQQLGAGAGKRRAPLRRTFGHALRQPLLLSFFRKKAIAPMKTSFALFEMTLFLC